MDNLEFARYMNAQHPDRWTQGTWYPATTPDGTPVEILLTHGRGRANGIHFIHVRIKVKVVIVSPDGERTNGGEGYKHARFNLRTGDVTWVE